MADKQIQGHQHGLDDVPSGWGEGKLVDAARLESPDPGEGATRVGYDDLLLPPLLGAETVQAALDALKGGGGGGGAPNNATYLTLTAAAGLTNERVFTPGTGLSIVDGGPGLAYTVNVTGAYSPAVPSDWAPAPSLYSEALDQIVANGAGHFQKARDPLNPTPLYPAQEIYVSTTGSDDGGLHDGTSPATAFASMARALQSLPAMLENADGAYIGIEFGAGIFKMPRGFVFPPRCFVAGIPPTTIASYTVDATVMVPAANTKATGNRVVLNTLALASTVPPGTLLYLPATTTPGVAMQALVYRSDNSGPGGKLALWIVGETNSYIVNLAVGATVDVQTYTTIFEYDDGSEVTNGEFYYINHRPVGDDPGPGRTEVVWDNTGHYLCDLRVNSSVRGYSYVATCFVKRSIAWYSSARLDATWIVWAIDSYPTSLSIGPYIRGSGSLFMSGEHAFVNVAAALSGGPGGISAQDTVLRAGGGVSTFLVADSISDGNNCGGTLILGDLLEPRDLAGVVIVGAFTGSAVVGVGPNKNVQVTIGPESSVVASGVLNRMTIGGITKSADVSGTRLVGGFPLPGGWGPSAQYVSATGLTWNGVSRMVVFDTITMGVGGDFTLPAIGAGGEGVTDNAQVQLVCQDGTNAVTIKTTGTDKLNLVASGTKSIGGGGVAAGVTATCRVSNVNWMIP